MPAERAAPSSGAPEDYSLVEVARFPGMRALAWSNDTLYASRGYEILRSSIRNKKFEWERIARYRPALWRAVTCKNRLTSRLVRDGFHALSVLPSGHLVGAVPGAMVRLVPGESEFKPAHITTRGTRPLHVTATPNGRVFFGEYFDNPARDQVHIYASEDYGSTWQTAHTFPAHSVRHVHNIVHDPWENCLWILTGDYGEECQILRASCDLQTIDVALSGNQQARAVAAVPTAQGLYFSSDTPLEGNHVYRLDRGGNLATFSALESSSIYGCNVGNLIFFTTMIEPSEANPTQYVRLYGGLGDGPWRPILKWKKDRWPMRLFQYGNAILPDGENRTPYLAVTTIAVEQDDFVTTIFELQ